jgi:hypothetical protein
MDFLLGGSLTALAISGITGAFLFLGDDLERNPSVPWHVFCEKARTGDVILTSNTSVLTVSRVVTRSAWTHCGILYRDEESGSLYEWSAHTAAEGVINERGDTSEGGAQLVPLEFQASSYGGFFWRPMREFRKRERARLSESIKALAHQAEFSDLYELGALLGGPFASAFNGSSGGMLCSHVVALSYMAAGAIANDRHITQFVPDTFGPDGDAAWLLPVSPVAYSVTGCDTGRLIKLSRRDENRSGCCI